MGKLINNLCFRKYKFSIIIGWISLSIALFFITGNYAMIRSVEGLNGVVSMNSHFSATYFDRIILFFLCVIFIGLLFKNKEDEIREAINLGTKGRNIYFLNKAILIYGVFVIPMIINILIKMVFYFSYKNIFVYSQLVLNCYYFFVIGLFFSTIIFFMNILINDRFLAGMIPIFFIEGIIIFFGVSRLLISDRLALIRWIIEIIGDKILNVFSLFHLNFNVDKFSLVRQVVVISTVLVITNLLLYLIYISINMIEEKNLDKPYFFEITRNIIYAFMSLLVSFCFVSALGYFIIMFIPRITYVDGTFYVNIISLAFAFIIYWFLESSYKSKFIDKGIKENNLEREVLNKVSELVNNNEIEVLEEDLEPFKMVDLNEEYKKDCKLSEEEIKIPKVVQMSFNIDEIENYVEIEEEFDISEISLKNTLKKVEDKEELS